MSQAGAHSSSKFTTSFANIALGLGVLGLLGCAAGFVTDRAGFMSSYLIGFLWMAAIPLGSLCWLQIQYLSGGKWGLIGRRHFEAAVKTLPIVGLLFIPVIIGLHDTFEWSHADIVAKDPILRNKAKYLDPTFFIIRYVVYFGLWSLFAFALNAWARKQDQLKDMRLKPLMHNFSGLGLMMMALTLTFASTDWIMSVEPHWFSTMLPVIFMATCLQMGISWSVVVFKNLKDTEPYKSSLKKNQLHDYGNLLLAMTMFWTYCSFSQLLITWSGNLREETPWYLKRLHGGYEWVALALVALHFFVPFFALLMKPIKRDANKLVWVAMWQMAFCWVDFFWLIKPAFTGHGSHSELHFSLWDFAAPIGLMGLWIWLYLGNLKKNPLLPEYDTYLEDLHHG
ncbi:MAG: hypothetical protein K1Y36_11305 [Blastocatellia bacterium]|nr:hypothetical protein [Blastocatellia bacterium]